MIREACIKDNFEVAKYLISTNKVDFTNKFIFF